MKIKLCFVTARGKRMVPLAVVGTATVASVAARGMLSLGLGKLPHGAKFSCLSSTGFKQGSLEGRLPLLPSLKRAGFISSSGCVLVSLPMRRTRGG